MYALLDIALKQVMKFGTLHVTDQAGTVHHYGDGTGTPVGFSITMPAPPSSPQMPTSISANATWTGATDHQGLAL